VRETSVITATVLGALVGGVAGYLFFTERGKAIRRQMEPALEEFTREFVGFRRSVQRIAGIASESWDVLSDAAAPSAPGAVRH
jgi:gas vesicle protein